MQIASLRFPVVFAGNRDTFLAEQGTAIRGHGAFWTYIDARDAARACQLALETALDGHQAFNICASKTLIATPTGELIRKYLPEVTDIRNSDSGNWAGYDAGKAEMILGFTARHLLLP